VRREGDTCLSPGVTRGRRSGYPGDASAEQTGAAAARATRRERVTERHPGPRKQRRARCREHGARSGRGAASGEEWNDKAGGVIRTRTDKKKQRDDATGAEWRSTGRSGGADGDGAKGAWSSVTGMRYTSGAAPTRRGAGPLLKRKEKQLENIMGLPLPAQEQAARLPRFVRRTDTVFLWLQTGDTQSRTKNYGGAGGCTTSLPSVMPQSLWHHNIGEEG